MVGLRSGRESRHRAAAEESDRHCVSNCGCVLISFFNEAAVSPTYLAAASAYQRFVHHPAHRCALARSGHVAQSARFLFLFPQRAWRISRLPVVLFHQRAAFALSEPALPAGLRYRAAVVVLALSPSVAFSLERILPCPRQTFLQTVRPRRANAVGGAVPDGIHPCLFHLFHDTRILLDALLSGASATARLRDGAGRRLDSPRNAPPLCHGVSSDGHAPRNPRGCAAPAYTR